MNGFEFLADKIGRKQLIAIMGMILLAQMGAASWQVMAVAFAGIVSQLYIDKIRQRQSIAKKPPDA